MSVDFFNNQKMIDFIPHFSKDTLNLLIISIPAGLSVSILSLCNNVPIYLLDYYSGPEKTGLYGGLNFFFLALNIALTPLFSTIGPRLSRSFNNDIADFIKIVSLLSGCIIFSSVIIAVLAKYFGAYVLTIALSKEFSGLADQFSLLMIAAGFWFNWAFMNFVIQAARYYWLLASFNLFMLAISICIGLYWIPGKSLDGAILCRLMTTVLGALFSVPLIWWIVRKKRTEVLENK